MAEVASYEIGEGLKVVDDVLMVDSTDVAQKNDKRPITSHGVAVEVGDLDKLLEKI